MHAGNVILLCCNTISFCFFRLMRLAKAFNVSQRYLVNLGQNEWNISTTPPPHFNDAKMAGFGLRATSSLLWGGRGLIVPFHSVQDSILDKMNGTFQPPLPPI